MVGSRLGVGEVGDLVRGRGIEGYGCKGDACTASSGLSGAAVRVCFGENAVMWATSMESWGSGRLTMRR
jgi:hypothetical protein